MQDTLIAFQKLGCRMSLKIHFLHSHLDFFPENMGDVSDEHGERFHQDISEIETRYQGKPSDRMIWATIAGTCTEKLMLQIDAKQEFKSVFKHVYKSSCSSE